MSSVEQDTMNLSNIPSDIMRKIIHAGPENVNNIRMISRRWNAVVTDVAIRLPIKVIGWFAPISAIKNSDRLVTMGMHIPADYRNYFGVDHCNFLTIAKSNGCVAIFTQHSITAHTLRDFERMFVRCSSVERVNLHMNINQYMHEIRLIGTAMEDVEIDTIAITSLYSLNEDAKAAILLHLLKKRRTPIKCLEIAENTIRETIRFSLFTARDGRKSFVSLVLKFAREVRIDVCKVYFDKARFWRDMIAEMNAAGEIVARLVVENSEDGKKRRSVRLTANNEQK